MKVLVAFCKNTQEVVVGTTRMALIDEMNRQCFVGTLFHITRVMVVGPVIRANGVRKVGTGGFRGFKGKAGLLENKMEGGL